MADGSDDFLRQLRRVNAERYQAWASRLLMLCEHCGASEHAETEQCAPPFNGQPHSFTRSHPYLTVENDAGIMFDALELGGEVGELLNVVKKLEREERGWRGSRADPADFADECADVLICLDKLARRRGVDLIAATIAKFNATSDKVGLPHKLSTLSADAIRQGEETFRPYSEWNEDDGDVLWWKLPVQQAPYVGSPLDLGFAVGAHLYNQFGEVIGRTEANVGGWPFSADDEADLVWSRLPATPASHASDGGKA